jgi:1-acyl-sn-glycerol-3-phosphate acyltransferase
MRSFWLMFVVEFQNAFSDNTLKFVVTLFIMGMGFPIEKQNKLVPLVGAVFALPFVLFSMAGGFFADRFSKRQVAITIKCIELGIMSVATLGFWLGNLPLMLVAVFLMSTHSAFFGPTKYGMLPELLPEKKLSWGNGIFGLGTFASTIGGQIFAGFLSDEFGKQQVFSGGLLILLALTGLSLCTGLTRLRAADPGRKFRADFLGDFYSRFKTVRRDQILFLAVIGNAFLWFLGALLQFVILFYGRDILHLDDQQTTYLMAALILGIGVGSLVAGFLSGNKIEYGLVPLGMIGLTVFGAVLSQINPAPFRFGLNLSLLGFFAGFYNVPINAIIQHRPEPEEKGSVIAASTFLSWVGILLAAGVYYLLKVPLKLTLPQIFLVGAGMSVAAAIYGTLLAPDSLMRLLLWLATRSVYRIRVVGRDNIPEKGGALFVCNHVSWMDALLLIASTDRAVRFLMLKEIYEQRWMKPFARILGVIPISSEQRPRELLQSLRAASDAIRQGHVVCIFAEGQITRIGQLLPFRRGMERIMQNVDAPIVPVALDGVLGSPSSFKHGRFVWKIPSRIPHPVTVSFGAPLPAKAGAFEVRQAVQELLADAWRYRRDRMEPLPRAWLRTARRHPRRFAMADAQTPKVTFGKALVKTIFLARRLKRILECGDTSPLLTRRHVASNQSADTSAHSQTAAAHTAQMIGIFLPPSVPGALVNYALMLLGKVPVNLNYTLSESALASCVRQCEIKTVVTSRLFLEKVKLALPCETIFLEDLAAQPRFKEKLVAWAMARFLPVRWLERSLADGRNRREAFPSSGNPDLPPAVPSPIPSPILMGEGKGEGINSDGRGEGQGEVREVLRSMLIAESKRSDDGHTPSSLNSLATVIFSSGSTGDPKGVMLSHYNIASNIAQIEQVFGLDRRDCLLGILPFFHSFGFTGTLWLPAVLGVGVVFHPNPLDAKGIGPLVRAHAVTFLLATPTFLQLYLRGCAPADFGSLRLVMTGAEKLPDRLAAAFEEHFGIRPMEGYGCTECAPVVAVNAPDFRAAGLHQVGVKRGKIGHPLPGVSVRIASPENPWNGETLPLGQPGLMLVRGPNVMQGYLGKPEKTAEVLRPVAAGILPAGEPGILPGGKNPASVQSLDNSKTLEASPANPGGKMPPSTPGRMPDATHVWYCTGDVAALDEDGFLQITDRLSRFSKIGGEMVPHVKVEEKLHELAGATEQTFVVTGLPDEKKGERLVVLHKLVNGQLPACLEKLAACDLPNLWKPRPDQFFHVESFPLLGTGKLDLRQVREIAQKLSTAGQPA